MKLKKNKINNKLIIKFQRKYIISISKIWIFIKYNY